MITTVDNPYNPFTHFDEWMAYDERSGYHTMSFMARLIHTSDELSEADQDVEIENVIDEMVRENVLGIYRKVAAPADLKKHPASEDSTVESVELPP